MIGAALAAKAAGAGHRSIAHEFRRAPATVRGWLRRFASRLEVVRAFFTVLAVRVESDPVVPGPGENAWSDAIAAISSVRKAIWRRFEPREIVGEVTLWRSACAATSGRLLSPRWSARIAVR
ncbi:hypothetical protein GCM10027456_59850 [Kineosporia babensis]